MAFKMKGHTLPGPNQKASPLKDFGISGTIAAIIAAAKAKAAVTAGVVSAASGIASAASKTAQKRKAEKLEGAGKLAEVTGGMKSPGSKTRII